MKETMKEWCSLSAFNSSLYENDQIRPAKRSKYQIERRKKEKISRKANKLRRINQSRKGK